MFTGILLGIAATIAVAVWLPVQFNQVVTKVNDIVGADKSAD